MQRFVALIIPVLLVVQPLPADAAPPAAAQGDIGYEGLVRIANEICIAPIEYGGTVGGEAKAGVSASPTGLGAGAVLSRILSKFISVNLSGSLKASGTAWYGVLQKDLAQAHSSRNACAERVFDHLFDAFHISDKNTLKVVSKPSGAPAAYQRINTRITNSSSNTTTAIENENGEQSVVNGSNNHVINGNGNTVNEVAKADRSHYLKMLQPIFLRGSELLAQLRNTQPTDATIQKAARDYNDWLMSSANQIQSEMTPAAASRFYTIAPMDVSYGLTVSQTAPLSDNSIKVFNILRTAYPLYLDNIEYLMDHDTMDPQNAGN